MAGCSPAACAAAGFDYMSYTAEQDSSLAVLLFLYMAFEAMVLRAPLPPSPRSLGNSMLSFEF